jgi:glucose/arabinose dehydrogenase
LRGDADKEKKASMSGTSGLLAQLVAIAGDAAITWRRLRGTVPEQAIGTTPTIPAARPQGAIPTLKMPSARGWAHGQTPTASPGLKVNAFATSLKHPRWLQVLPNGDVTVAEALTVPAPPRTLFNHAMVATMKRAAAAGVSPNRITLLRDTDGDGVAETHEAFLEHLNQPFGMALLGDTFYVGNTDGVIAFEYRAGATRIGSAGRRLATFKPGGHWTRSLLASPDGRKLYVGVGSLSNIAEHGLDAEQGRACIYEIDLAGGSQRIFASGLRNPVGLAWEPNTGVLWTVVNERDGLGDETPPDYLTAVREGGFYGWPYCYWGRTVDDRVRQDAALVATAITPDYALGGHTASLGLCWLSAGTLPGFPDGMVIGQHGSWNRSTLSGYKVAFVPFEGGRPSGPPRDILGGFLAPDEREAYGRPVGVAVGPDRRSLLVADDVGDVVWRVTAA